MKEFEKGWCEAVRTSTHQVKLGGGTYYGPSGGYYSTLELDKKGDVVLRDIHKIVDGLWSATMHDQRMGTSKRVYLSKVGSNVVWDYSAPKYGDYDREALIPVKSLR